MKRLLVVAFSVPPTMGPSPGRAWHLARYLPEHGWEAVVLTPRHPERHVAVEKTREHRTYRLPLRRVAEPSGVGYWLQETGYRDLLFRLRGARAPSISPDLPGLYGKADVDPEVLALEEPPPLERAWDAIRYAPRLRPDARAGWILPALQAARAVCEALPPQAAYSISPPLSAHRIAMRVAAILGIPWIADLREPWSGSRPWSGGAPSLLDGWNRARILRRARVAELPASFDEKDIAAPAPPRPPAAPFVLVHVGPTARNGRDATILLDAVRHLFDTRMADPASLRVRLIGASDPGLPRAVNARHLSTAITLEPRVPWQVSLERQVDAGALAIAVGPQDRGRTPDRLLEAWCLKKPYLLFGPATAGFQPSFGDSASLAAAIMDCMRGVSLPVAGEAEIAPHRARSVVARLAELLEEPGGGRAEARR